jgi:hypothetical protein
MPLRWERWPEF